MRWSLYPQKRKWFSTIVMSALCHKRTHAPQQIMRSGSSFATRAKRYKLFWTGPIEWNVLARISRPLELEVERID